MTVVNDTFFTLTVVNRTFCKDGISVIFCIKLMLSAEILSRQVFEENILKRASWQYGCTNHCCVMLNAIGFESHVSAPT